MTNAFWHSLFAVLCHTLGLQWFLCGAWHVHHKGVGTVHTYQERYVSSRLWQTTNDVFEIPQFSIISSSSCWFVSKMLYVAGVILSHVWVWLILDLVEERVFLEWTVETFVSCWLAERTARSDFLFLTSSASLNTAVPLQCDLIIRRRLSVNRYESVFVHQPLFVRWRFKEENHDVGWKGLKLVTEMILFYIRK